MNFSAILDALNQASAFALYRLRVAIRRKRDDVLDRNTVDVGQTVGFVYRAGQKQ